MSTRRKFLVVADDSPEFQAALRFACRRARSTGGYVALLRVIEPAVFEHWSGVRDEIARQQRLRPLVIGCRHGEGDIGRRLIERLDVSVDRGRRGGLDPPLLIDAFEDVLELRRRQLTDQPGRQKFAAPAVEPRNHHAIAGLGE